MEKRLGVEGSPAAMMVQLMRKYGHNKDITIEVGTVTAALPDIKIYLPDDGLTLDRDDLIIAEHLVEHKRPVSLQGGTVTGSVTPSGSLNSLKVVTGEMTVHSSLKLGDPVIIIGDDDTQFYYLIDKAVMS